MANIYVTKIEGYAEMSPEDKVAALEAYEYDDGSNLKSAVDKATHEAAEYKKQLKALQDKISSEDGQANQTIQSLKEQVEQLTRTNTLAEYTAQYGPLRADAVPVSDRWTWIDAPWPWEWEA